MNRLYIGTRGSALALKQANIVQSRLRDLYPHIPSKIVTIATTGDKILEERVKATLANATWTVNRDDVLANPGNYFINNYWPAVSWDAFGHFSGAYRIFEDLKTENLNLLRTDKPLVTYCYTGQTSGIVTTWLQIMGYDNARSLSFGANGIVYDQLKVSSVDDAKKKSWKGDGSGSANNFGYYDATNTMHNPL